MRQEILEDDQTRQQQEGEVELDQTRVGRLSRMESLQSHAMSEATHQRREWELKQIAAALKRIDDGEYGECLSCGGEINPKRLEVDPSVSQCIACAEKEEH